MLTSIRASKVLITYNGQLFQSSQQPIHIRRQCLVSLQLTLPHPSNQPFVRYALFYILFLLFHCLPFSITIELFSKTSFTLLDSYAENAIDLLICPREKRTLSSHKRLFQHLCHLSRRYNPLHTNTGLCLPCRHKSSKEYRKTNQFTHGSNTPIRTKFKTILAFGSATSLPLPREFQIPHSVQVRQLGY